VTTAPHDEARQGWQHSGIVGTGRQDEAPRWRVPRAPTALEVAAAQSQGRWPAWDKASGGARLMAALCSTPR
jgi:hypothetical protein